MVFSLSVMSDSETPWTAVHQASLSFIISQSLLKLMSIESVMKSNHLILCPCLLLLPLTFPSIRIFSNELALCIRWQKCWSFGFRNDLFYYWLVLSPCCQRDSQESSPAPQFKSINSLVLSLSYGPTLYTIYRCIFTSVLDYWKNYSFDFMDLCQQSNASAF